MLKTAILIAAMACTFLNQPAHARSADMLDTLGLTNKRPWVPSDAHHRKEEMVKLVPNIYTSNADMFDSVRMMPISLNDQMINNRRSRGVPHESPIFTNDNWTN